MIETQAPIGDDQRSSCAGCGGTKLAPIATIILVYHSNLGFTLALCEVCARDLANAVGFMCIRDGGWSKLCKRSS